MLARLLDAAARTKIRDEDELRRTICDVRKLVAKCTVVDGWDFGTLVVNCIKFVI